MNKPEQPRCKPNVDLMLVMTIENLMNVVNHNLEKLNIHNPLAAQALEEIDLFQKTTLFKLRKAFE